MGKCLSWKYFSLLLSLFFFHSQFPFSSSLSSNSLDLSRKPEKGILSSNYSQCSALLHFNHSLSLDSSASECENSYPKTGSWKEDKDCCTWDGVVCDNSTRHVIALHLSCSWLSGFIDSNSTLFLLRHLRSLNLAGNAFYPSLISSEFGRFQSLTHLNLSHSLFTNEIPYEISQLTSLVSLDLSHNFLSIKTPVWKRVIGNLTQLRELLLDAIDMSSITPNSLMNLSSSFTTLSLDQCKLQGTFEINIFRLPCIQTLNLGENWNLEVSLPKSNWSSTSLKFLSLYATSFSGELSDSIGSLKSLEYLDLNNCNFTGAIPTSLGNLTQIIYLDLSFNNFSGLLPLSIFDLPNLSSLYLDGNQLVGPLPDHVSGLNLLSYLSLSSNFLNGTLPSWLFSLTSLVRLTLDHNQFIGEIGEFKYNNSLDYLDLSYNMLQGSFPSSISRLVNLTYLSLSSNNLQGSIPSSISRLVNLTDLYLSSNNLSIMLDLELFSNLNHLKFVNFSHNNLLVSINNNLTFTLPNLERLYLSSCNISEFPIFLRIATNLQDLDLSNNRIHGQTPKWLGAVGRNSLHFLDLSNNFLTIIDKIPWKNLNYVDLRNNLLQRLFPMLNSLDLQYLFASNNNLTGEIPSLICNASLEVLDLSHNNFSGTIPKCLVLSNVLSVLDLRMNSLNGTIPATFSKGNSLRNINLNDNQLEGLLPRSLENCRHLEVLDLGNNKINGTFPYWLGSILKLQVLVIRSNKFRGRIGNPKTKFPFPNLRILDISNNEFSGPLPKKYFKYLKAMMNVDEGKVVLKNMGEDYYHDSLNVMIKGLYIEFRRIQTVFTTIDFSNNRFIGKIPQIIGRLKSLMWLSFSHNNLTGNIPSLFGNLANLVWLDLSFNKLSGEIPSLICNASSLEVLDSSHNNLSGTIPKCLVRSNVLSVLCLRMNSLNGTIPTIFSKGNNLRTINLNGNQLEGPLPRSLENCRDLEVLDLGNNKINGTFPFFLGSILKLRVLVIRSNKFQGRIGNPKTKFPFPNLRILDISNNEFNGPLPRNFFKYLKAMMNVDEGKVALKYMGDEYYHDSLNVMMKGLYVELVRIQTMFITIDFSNNRFIGEMPQIIGRLKSLLGVNFSHNNLTGYIPSSFGNLTNLEWLDLSFNKLDGEIPKKLADLPWLEVLKLSHNQLTGPIPSGKQFNTFNNDSYTNNLGLCGFPLTRTCNNHKSKQQPPSTLQQEDNLEPKNGFGWQAVSIGYGCGVIFGTLMGYLMFKIGKPKWIVRMVKLEQHILLRKLKNNVCRSGGRK